MTKLSCRDASHTRQHADLVCKPHSCMEKDKTPRVFCFSLLRNLVLLRILIRVGLSHRTTASMISTMSVFCSPTPKASKECIFGANFITLNKVGVAIVLVSFHGEGIALPSLTYALLQSLRQFCSRRPGSQQTLFLAFEYSPSMLIPTFAHSLNDTSSASHRRFFSLPNLTLSVIQIPSDAWGLVPTASTYTSMTESLFASCHVLQPSKQTTTEARV